MATSLSTFWCYIFSHLDNTNVAQKVREKKTIGGCILTSLSSKKLCSESQTSSSFSCSIFVYQNEIEARFWFAEFPNEPPM